MRVLAKPIPDATLNPLADIIRRETAAAGVISFARFMELALYCPQHGYYERKRDTVGQRGDFYTSVSVGPLFGELLACQFARWLGEMGTASPVIAEAGAHDGRLAADILKWLKHNQPDLFARLEYLIIEPSARRQQWQEETLAGFAGKVRWQSSLDGSRVNGVIFGNELLDAFPVRCFIWDALEEKWFERGVTVADGKFAWAKMPGDSFRNPFPQLEPVLPDGFVVEQAPAAEAWWKAAAGSLAAGRLVAIDYGLTAEEFFRPERCNGTLRAYHQHHPAKDLLANAGEQDLTAHVNFSAIEVAGESAGLKTEAFLTQPQFLTSVLADAVKHGAFGGWDASQVRQFQTLTHPDHLGRAFRVLVQGRPA
jgi:SAM-dependent MidA family methyltransferase